MIDPKWFKKAKVSKKLRKMSFEYDRKHKPLNWEKCALELEYKRISTNPDIYIVIGSRWSGLKSWTGRMFDDIKKNS